ncbi:MAG: response regulator [Chloroflexota bacterium]|nr:response regulator [Chloroflexota bacterium]MCY3638135.1 response regulator [Chloroflexota bacterium]MDE2686117.1 response regulator [Chloroflexota bacterium]
MTTETADRAIEILLVEDNPADVRLTEEVIKGSEHATNITVAEDGVEAMEILRGEGEHSGATRPDLILLDLRLPRKDGPEVLADINSDENLVNIPVMILTGTEAEQSLLNAYNIPPSRFCRKPIELQRFNNVVTQLSMFSRQPISLGAPAGEQASQESGGKRRWWWPFGGS